MKGYVDKKELIQQPSQEDEINSIASDDNKYDIEEKTELLSDNEYNSDQVRIIKNSVPSIDRYTVMIRNLPKQFRNENTLKLWLEKLFPKTIAKVMTIQDVPELIKLQNEIKFHSKALNKLSKKHDFDLQDLYNDDKLPTIYEGSKCCGCFGEDINLITYHRTNKEALMSRFNKMKRDGLICIYNI